MQILKNRFNRILLSALFLLLISGVATFFVLANSSVVVASDLIFRDIPLDHPVYELCHRLIRIGAVKSRHDMALAPFEKISAEDWNYALMRIGESSAQVIPEAVKFSSNREICPDSIVKRIQRLVSDECELSHYSVADCSRIRVYFMLEHCLFEYND